MALLLPLRPVHDHMFHSQSTITRFGKNRLGIEINCEPHFIWSMVIMEFGEKFCILAMVRHQTVFIHERKNESQRFTCKRKKAVRYIKRQSGSSFHRSVYLWHSRKTECSINEMNFQFGASILPLPQSMLFKLSLIFSLFPPTATVFFLLYTNTIYLFGLRGSWIVLFLASSNLIDLIPVETFTF